MVSFIGRVNGMEAYQVGKDKFVLTVYKPSYIPQYIQEGKIQVHDIPKGMTNPSRNLTTLGLIAQGHQVEPVYLR